MRPLACALTVFAVCAASPAQARDEDETAEQAPEQAHPTEASGVERPEAVPLSTSLLVIPRALLFVPRWTLEVVDAPLRLALYSYERYAVRQHIEKWFGGEGSVEAYPVVHVESGFGLFWGVSVAHTDVFGHRERLRAKGGTGGIYRQFYGFKLDSGELFGDLAVTGEFDIDLRGNARFSGFGNADLTDELPAMPVDAADRDLAYDTRYSQDTYRFELNGVYELTDLLTTKLSSAYITRTFDDTDDDDNPDISEAYDLDTLTGFGTGVEQIYTELSLALDNRSNTQSRVNVAVPNTGWKAAGFGGYAVGINSDSTKFARLGIDLQTYTRLWRTDRILALRAYGETVTGSLQDVPFMDLPSLGGSRRLRGFFGDRFHDRALAFVAAEYHFPVNTWMSSFMFTEVGRVFESVADVTWRDPRVGFGLGVQIHNGDKLLLRAHVASSSEGGVFLHLGVDPIFKQRARTKRK